MGILDWFRGSPSRKTPNLPAPLPPPSQTRIPSDLPPIRPPSKAGPSMDDEVKPYSEPQEPKMVVRPKMEPRPVTRARPQDERPAVQTNHIFISSDEYSTIMDHANMVRSKLLETDERLQSMAQLRSTEEKELLKWQEQLANLEKKLTYMEAVLEKAGEI